MVPRAGLYAFLASVFFKFLLLVSRHGCIPLPVYPQDRAGFPLEILLLLSPGLPLMTMAA